MHGHATAAVASRAFRSSESRTRPRSAASETPRPRRARRGRGRREHLARRPRRLPPSGRWRATTQAWQRPARALLSVTREARGSEAFTFRDARGLRSRSSLPNLRLPAGIVWANSLAGLAQTKTTARQKHLPPDRGQHSDTRRARTSPSVSSDARDPRRLAHTPGVRLAPVADKPYGPSRKATDS